MFSISYDVLKSSLNFAKNLIIPSKEEPKRAEYLTYLDQLKEERKADSSDDSDVENDLTPTLGENTAVKLTGFITKLESNFGFINRKLYFKTEAAIGLENLEVGSKVSYTAIRSGSDGNLIVTRINEVIEENWMNLQNDEKLDELIVELQQTRPEIFKTIEEVRTGKVIRCEGGTIIVDDYTEGNAITIELDKVETNFVFVEDDKVKMRCSVIMDETNYTAKTEFNKCLSIEPLLRRDHKGTVTAITKSYGIIDEEYYFKWDACREGYRPEVGSVALAHAIECEKPKFMWRCTMIIGAPLEDEPKQSLATRDPCENDNNFGVHLQSEIRFVFTDLKEKELQEIVVRNDGPESVQMLKLNFLTKRKLSQLTLLESKSLERTLEPGEEFKIKMEAFARFYGICEEVIDLKFSKFNIKRRVVIEVMDRENNAPSIGSGPTYARNNYTRKVININEDFVPG